MSLVRAYAAERVGYERLLIQQLPRLYQRQLNQLGAIWGAAAVLLGVPVGYAAWLIEKNLLLSLGLLAFTAVLVINLLRLIHSGGGTAPELAAPQDYRPSIVPALILVSLALLLSQPAQLMLKDAQTELAVQEHRVKMIEFHQASQLELGGAASAGFDDALGDCEFILLRLRLIWEHPRRATLFTLLYCLLALLPLYLQRAVFLNAVQAYESARYRHAAELIRQSKARASISIDDILSSHVGYRAKSLTRHFLSTPERQA